MSQPHGIGADATSPATARRAGGDATVNPAFTFIGTSWPHHHPTGAVMPLEMRTYAAALAARLGLLRRHQLPRDTKGKVAVNLNRRRAIMPPLHEIVPPVAIVCSVCGNKMGLVAVEHAFHQSVYTYQCINEHRQPLTIAKP
jgi:hypothetical protein